MVFDRRNATCSARPIYVALLSSIVALTIGRTALADNFSGVHYDASTDQLVITMSYRGTNPNHSFSLQWDQCKDAAGGKPREIAVQVLDSQWRDIERRDFKKTVRFGLADFHCRPAKVTVRTAPRFTYTLWIPDVRK